MAPDVPPVPVGGSVGGVTVRQATESDVDPMAAQLCRAFADDPVMAHVFRNEGRRMNAMRAYFTSQMRGDYLPFGGCYTTDDHLGAAVWGPAGKPLLTGIAGIANLIRVLPYVFVHLKSTLEMISLIEKIRGEGNTVGGVVEAVARGVPAGWGEPVFDKLEADLAKAMLSLPACKGFESGDGFAGTLLTGLEHNDPMRARDGIVFTTANRSGGIQGGISNGETIFFRAAFKPVATVMHEQDTVDVQGRNTTLKGRGRHDPCVLPRAVPMVEAMAALVLVDHALRQRGQCG